MKKLFVAVVLLCGMANVVGMQNDESNMFFMVEQPEILKNKVRLMVPAAHASSSEIHYIKPSQIESLIFYKKRPEYSGSKFSQFIKGGFDKCPVSSRYNRAVNLNLLIDYLTKQLDTVSSENIYVDFAKFKLMGSVLENKEITVDDTPEKGSDTVAVVPMRGIAKITREQAQAIVDGWKQGLSELAKK